MSVSANTCVLNRDYVKPCRSFAAGGIEQRIYIANKADIIGPTYAYTSTGARVVDNLTLKTGKRFYFADFQKDQNNITASLNGADGSGALHFAQALTVNIPALEPEAQQFMQELAQSQQGFVAIVESRRLRTDGTVAERELFVIGLLAALTVTSMDPATGQALTDPEGGPIVLTGAGDMPMDVIRPDPVLYPSTTPNAEFLAAMLAPAP